jgi:alkylation response protein AidB-like acyl-CoA dehydrogenase
MDFQLNDEQRLYRDTLRTFVDKEIVPVAREWEQSGRYPTEIVDASSACSGSQCRRNTAGWPRTPSRSR